MVHVAIRLAIGLAVITAAGWFLTRTWPLINSVETGRTPEYPDIVPQTYDAEAARLFDAALHAVDRLPRWTLVSYEEGRGEIRAEAATRLLHFVDDVIIRVQPVGAATRVHVRSTSRVGRGDFGQNARNIRTFFSELDHQMSRKTAHP